MPAKGLITNKIYRDAQVLIQTRYLEMKAEPLCFVGEDGAADEDILVIPVRKESHPHFRAMATTRSRRVGRSENDPTHTKCIDKLVGILSGKRPKIYTMLYSDNERTEQTIQAGTVDSAYEWWKDGESNRISFEGGDYIQPDICGRETKSFAAGRRNRSIIIEVINTHYPEQETFFRLLQLSAQNHIVIFYFIPKNKLSSKYNGYDEDAVFTDIRATYYLLDGQAFRYGKPVERKKLDNAAWYRELTVTYFEKAIKGKDAPSKSKGAAQTRA